MVSPGTEHLKRDSSDFSKRAPFKMTPVSPSELHLRGYRSITLNTAFAAVLLFNSYRGRRRVHYAASRC